MKLADIVRQRRAELDLTLKEVAEIVGVSEATIQRYESGEIENPRHNRIASLAEALKVPPEYLMGWEREPEPFDIFSIPGILPIETKKIPLLGGISCGELKYEDEEFEGYVEVGSHVKADYAIRANGDSMTGAFIRDGDLVFIRQQTTAENDDIVAVSIEGEITLKRFKQVENLILLFPENTAYDVITVDLNNKTVNILGKAVGFYSNAK